MDKPQESLAYNAQQYREICRRVAQGEGLHLEFKRKAAYPEKIVREMIAFANTRGGTVLIGVSDDGSIPGLKYPEGESFVIQGALKKCRPALAVTETFIAVGHARTIIQYDIPESKKKPHYLVETPDARSSFVRVDDKSIQASREVLEIARRRVQQKDTRFHYGEHEKFLMEYLDEKPTITLKEFIQLRKIKRFYASKKLVLLVLADVLRIIPHEKGDLYALATRPRSAGDVKV